MRACPDCNKRTKKDGPPTLSPSGFLDQRIGCDCGWCGVESEILSEDEAKEFRAKPKQLKLI